LTDGERWASELLGDLRTARFRPHAWARFLRSSFARAKLRRLERPRLWLETIALLAVGTAAWAGIGASGRPGLALAGGLWWLGVCLMLDWHLGMVERPDGRALEGLGLPNLLCLLRAGLVPALPVLSPTALAVALTAAHATDILDGWLARSRDQVTRLGLWLDGAVDGIVLSVAAWALAGSGLLAKWAAGLVVARYAAPWLAVAMHYFARATAPSRAGHVSGRFPGFVALAGLVLAALGVTGGAELAGAGAVGGLATSALTLIRARVAQARSSAEPARTPLLRRAG
jgi:phosphatidylglycerophosphate synthase